MTYQPSRCTRVVSSVLVLLLARSAALPRHCAAAEPAKETKAQRDKRMAWWREARFGMFIHWGLYAVPAGTWKGKRIKGIGEWIMNRAKIPVAEYEPLVKQFNPVTFDARQWARIARQAGMKYIVITSKHHDGFCLWDSTLTDYDIMGTRRFEARNRARPIARCYTGPRVLQCSIVFHFRVSLPRIAGTYRVHEPVHGHVAGYDDPRAASPGGWPSCVLAGLGHVRLHACYP